MADRDLDRALDALRHWKLSGTGRRTCFSAVLVDRRSSRWATVLVMRKRGESIDDLVRRGLSGLQSAKTSAADRPLFNAVSPSRFAN
jgi:hypothetical protein